jgi:Short C-terminal domain/Phospholipase_D-nuclease N-terminal
MDDFGLLDVFLSMFWFMLLISWIWLIISIFGDIFRDRELGGGAKALWTLFLIFAPWLGAIVYLIVRGNSMNQRTLQAAQEREASMRAYVQQAAGTSTADELRQLGDLRAAGTISDEDYERAKAKVLA